MKALYMEIMEKYNHEVPEDFKLSEYLIKKEMETAEWKEYEEKFRQLQKRKKTKTSE
jgi:hypothetical protein